MSILVSVYDKKSQKYAPAHGVDTIANAIRSFEQACLNKESFFNKYPLDFELVQVGDFDDYEGSLLKTEKKILACATDYVQVERAKEA